METLLVRVLPKNRPALLNASKDLPTGPITSNSGGSVSQNRTFPDLLKNQNDEANFTTIASSELIKVTVKGKLTYGFKAVDLYSSQSLSPDGRHLLLTTIQKPFSYIVPYFRFPSKSVVVDLSGNW